MKKTEGVLICSLLLSIFSGSLLAIEKTRIDSSKQNIIESCQDDLRMCQKLVVETDSDFLDCKDDLNKCVLEKEKAKKAKFLGVVEYDWITAFIVGMFFGVFVK
jgi:hypothetical protein